MKIRTGGGIAERGGHARSAPRPFVKPAPESYELLNSGVADGVFFPLESIVSFKLDKVIKQATLFPGGLYSSAFGFFMNEDKWNKLVQAGPGRIIEKSRGETLARLAGKSWDEADQRGAGGAEEGRRPRSSTADARAASRACRSAPAPIIEDWIKKAERQGRRRRQGAGRVPRGAEEGRRRASRRQRPVRVEQF